MLHRITVATIALLLFVFSSSEAQTRKRQKKAAVSERTLALYEPGEFDGVKYRLMKPIDFDTTKTYPLILSLHGAGGKGTDNVKNLRNWNEYLADESLRRKHPCFVLAPQSAISWNDPTSPVVDSPNLSAEAIASWPAAWRSRIDRYRQRLTAAPKGNLHTVLRLIDEKLSKQFKIDVNRIYCIGHSMGGMGTFTAVYQHPDRFAAAIPTAGGFPPWRDASRIKDVPTWTFHGAADTVVPTDFTRYVFSKMKKLGGNMKYTELRGVGHGANAIAFKYSGDNAEDGYITQYASDRPDKTSDVWDWLFAQRLDKHAQEESGKRNLTDFRDSSSIRNRQPILIAHRGGVITAQSPECSVAAIRLAKHQGYDMVELDIRQSKDHVPIVFHDNDMKKACGISKSISDLNADEIVRITYINTDQMICTLDQALSVCRSQKLGLMLDVKITGDEEPLFRKIVTLIKKYGYENSSITINGDPDLRKHLKEIALLTVTQDEFKKVQQGLPCDLRNKFWFGLPHQLPSAMVRPLQGNGAYVIPAINTFRYPADGHYELARKDIQRLNEAGVDGYQIDSVYRPLFLEKKREKL